MYFKSILNILNTKDNQILNIIIRNKVEIKTTAGTQIKLVNVQNVDQTFEKTPQSKTLTIKSQIQDNKLVNQNQRDFNIDNI